MTDNTRAVRSPVEIDDGTDAAWVDSPEASPSEVIRSSPEDLRTLLRSLALAPKVEHR